MQWELDFLLEYKWFDGAGLRHVAADDWPGEFVHRCEAARKRNPDRASIVLGQRTLYAEVRKLQSLHLRHYREAPSEDVGTQVDQKRPRRRHPRPFSQHSREKLLGRKLPMMVRSAAQHELTAGAGHEYVLAEQPALHRLGRDQPAQTESIEGGLQLRVAYSAKAFRIFPRGHRPAQRSSFARSRDARSGAEVSCLKYTKISLASDARRFR